MKFFKQIPYLNTCHDPAVLKKVTSYLIVITQRLMKEYPYLNNTACIKFIDYYLDIHRKRYYNGTIVPKAFLDRDIPF